MAISDIVSDIVSAMNVRIAGVVGVTYKPLSFIANVSRNNFRQSNDRYGVLHGPASQLPGVTRNATFSQVFTVVLTKGYRDSAISDSVARDKSMQLYGEMLEIHQDLIREKAGLPGTVLHVQDTIEIQEPEYLDDEKVTVLRANVEILYRFDLI